jgi:Tol biopolymer transport system component
LALVGGLAVALLGSGGSLAKAPPVPPARLVYVTGLDGDRPVVWGANADGSGRVRLAVGADQAKISPDGGLVALTESDRSETHILLMVVPSGDPDGTAPAARRLVRAKDDLELLAWAADGSEVAVQSDGRLVVIDVASGAKHVIAGTRSFLGFFEASFAPSGRQLVFARHGRELIVPASLGRASSLGLGPSCSNLFVANVDGSGRRALTHDGLASNPLWGPDQIAFSRARKCSRVGGFFPAQLWLMRPDGHGAHPLTHVHLGPGSFGLSPTAWSDDERRLLAEHDTPSETGIAETDGAWTVDVPSGRARQLRVDGSSVFGDGLSRDGTTVLADVLPVRPFGFPQDPSKETIATIPWGGGRPHVLARGASSPSWNR